MKELCDEYGVSKSAVHNWISKYSATATQTGNIVSAKRLDSLERRLKRVYMENEIFRKCGYSASDSMEKRLETIKKLMIKTTSFVAVGGYCILAKSG